MIQIYVDSAANIPAVDVEKYDIHVIPFINYVGEDEIPGFEAGLTPEEERAKGKDYYDRIRNGMEVKTSLINSATFQEIFEKELKAGNDLLYISLSSNISGTYNAARMAAEDLAEDYTANKICLVDAMNASLGQGVLAIYARFMIEKGLTDVEEIARILREAVPHTNGVFTVDNLKYLSRSGRIKGGIALAGNLLSIKPILKGNKDGYIVQAKMIRGRKKALSELADIVCQNVVHPEKQFLCVAQADVYEESLEFIEKIQSRTPFADVINTSYDYCTGSHVGPGTIAVFFIAYDREMGGQPEGYQEPEIFQYL